MRDIDVGTPASNGRLCMRSWKVQGVVIALTMSWWFACGAPPPSADSEQAVEQTSFAISGIDGVGALPDPVAIWNFDLCRGLQPLGTIPDASPLGGADAVPSNGPRCAPGWFARGARFDGVDDIVQVADQPRFHFTDAVTVTAWVHPSRITGEGTIVGKWYAPDSYLLFIENGRFIFRVALPGGTFGTDVSVSAPAVVGKWTHLTGVFDGQQVSLYVNGVLAANAPAAGVLQDSTQPIAIGNHPTWAAYQGVIDEIRLYAAALRPSQVFELATDVTGFNRFTGNPKSTRDIDVTYISRSPRLAYEASPNLPVQGQTVQWIAHIRNRGTAPTGMFQLYWYVDGVHTSTTFVPSIPVGGQTQRSLSRTWDAAVHNIAAFADPNNFIREKSERNNLRVVRTNALMAGLWVESDVRDYFDANQYAFQASAGIGDEANSWEDWAQRQMAVWNRALAVAFFPSAPDAGLDRVRLDEVTVVPDGTLVGGGNYPDTSDHTVDMMWGFTQADPNFYNVNDPNSAFNVEYSLLHEMHHARYLTDTYGLDIDGRGVEVTDDNGQRIFPNVGGVVYSVDNFAPSMMKGGSPVYIEWEVDWLNVYARQRPLPGWANFNAHLGILEYMTFIPKTAPFLGAPPYAADHVLKIVDRNGQVVPGARVRVYQTIDAGGGSKLTDDVPEVDAISDTNGLVDLGPNPFSVPMANVEGYTSYRYCDDFIRIQSNGQEWDAWLDLSAVHVAFFRGARNQAVYVCRQGDDAAHPHGASCLPSR